VGGHRFQGRGRTRWAASEEAARGSWGVTFRNRGRPGPIFHVDRFWPSVLEQRSCVASEIASTPDGRLHLVAPPREVGQRAGRGGVESGSERRDQGMSKHTKACWKADPIVVGSAGSTGKNMSPPD
jgi:hypothetical protein